MMYSTLVVAAPVAVGAAVVVVAIIDFVGDIGVGGTVRVPAGR